MVKQTRNSMTSCTYKQQQIIGYLTLLLVLAWQSDAFVPTQLRFLSTTSIQQPSAHGSASFVATKHFSTFSSNDTCFGRDDNPRIRIFEEEVMDNDEKPSSVLIKEKLPWISMFALFLYTQVHGGSSVFPQALGLRNVAFSAVSASFLRRSSSFSSKPRILKRMVVGGIIAAWQISQSSVSIVNVMATSWPKFISWYLACLAKFPLPTKAVTCGLISVLGDAIAQLHEERIRVKKEGYAFDFVQNYDQRRGLSRLLDSMFVSGPLLHFSYNILEHMFPIVGGGIAATIATSKQMLFDNLIVDSISVAVMFFSTGLGEGYSIRQLIPQFKKDYIKTLKTGWTTSIFVVPLGFALFRFVPLSLRVLGMNFIDVIWEAVVSFMIHRRRKSESPEVAAATS